MFYDVMEMESTKNNEYNNVCLLYLIRLACVQMFANSYEASGDVWEKLKHSSTQAAYYDGT